MAIIPPADYSTPAYFSCDGTWTSPTVPFECQWNFGDRSATARGVNVEHKYNHAGTYQPSLTVCGQGCCSDPMSQVITIYAPCTPTINPRGPYSGIVGEKITFRAAVSGCNGTHYVWDYGDGSVHDGKRTSDKGQEDRHAYTSARSYTVRLSVYVNDVLKGNALTTATIAANQAPVANPGGPYNGVPGKAIAFDGTRSSDPEGRALTYKWNFSDGSPVVGDVSPTHTYASRGNYTVTLVVNDGWQDSAPVSTTVHVDDLTWLSAVLQLLLD
jgi:PKD repeat protein